MQIIQAATKWPAETLRIQDRTGTVAEGKLADLIIVDEDPLQNIANLEMSLAYDVSGLIST
jgi:imidazolonepropionase-like amidohydrolase